jgi:hypothetical protein
MTSDNPLSGTSYLPPHRLIVRARLPSGAKNGYFWEIIRDDDTHNLVRQSSESFKTMEEAYTVGSVILNKSLTKNITPTPTAGLRPRLLSPMRDIPTTATSVSRTPVLN